MRIALVKILSASLYPKVIRNMHIPLSTVELTNYNVNVCNARLSFAVKFKNSKKLSLKYEKINLLMTLLNLLHLLVNMFITFSNSCTLLMQLYLINTMFLSTQHALISTVPSANVKLFSIAFTGYIVLSSLF